MVNHPRRQVGSSTVKKLRNMYREAWNQRKWPHSDDYIRELWLEERGEVRNGQNKVPPAEVWERCLLRMRENHSFEN
jgi:hypothetical protein